MKLIVKIIFLLACLPLQAQISSTIYSGAPNHGVSSGNHNQQGNVRRSNGAIFNRNPSPSVSLEAWTARQNKFVFENYVKHTEKARIKIQTMDYREEREEILDYADDISSQAFETDLDGTHGGAYEDLMSLAFDLLDVATSYLPFVSNARDTYEAVIGRNLMTGEEMPFGSFERNMAIVGAVAGPLAGSLTKAGFNSYRVYQGFFRANKINPGKIVFAHDKVLSELKDTVGFLKRTGVTDTDFIRRFTDAFKRGAKTRVLQEDLKVYRYYNPKYSTPKSNWVTTKKVNNPVEYLALEHDGHYEMVEWIIPKGTEILEGIVAPNWGRKGGGFQIFVNEVFLK